MIDVKMNLTDKVLGIEGMEPRVAAALSVIRSEFIGFLSNASPVGYYGAMQGGWIESSTEISSTSVRTSVTNTQPYTYYVIHGSEPARRNPGGFLVQWVDKKLTVPQQYRIARYAGMSETAARNALNRSSVQFHYSSLTVAVAFIIGRARMKRGSKGNDFVQPIIDENLDFWTEILLEAATNRRAS